MTLTFGAGLALAACQGIGPAQPAARKVRIGYLGGSTDSAALRSTVEPCLQGLRELGWTEGQNLAPIEFRWAEGKDEFPPGCLTNCCAWTSNRW